ncbi:MAG TPA: serine hydrolase [Patescibacteria group bacterium]|nr:serine hydrolase [Patescibacteria group bacterium]
MRKTFTITLAVMLTAGFFHAPVFAGTAVKVGVNISGLNFGGNEYRSFLGHEIWWLFTNNLTGFQAGLSHTIRLSKGLAHPQTHQEVPGIYDYYHDDTTPRMNRWLPEYILPGGANYVSAVWKDFAPGQAELYSNIGTSLLAYIVERVSGEEYSEYCRNHIFLPLDMTHSGFWFRDLDMARVALPYDDNYIPFYHYSFLAYPVGGIKSSIAEFSHFLIAYMNGGIYKGSRILNQDTVNQILTIQNPASGTCLLWQHGVGNWYMHNGGERGFATHAAFQKDDRLGFIIFTNKDNESVYPVKRLYELIRNQAYKYR